MKEKVTRWVQKVNSGNFSIFPDLEQFLKTCQWDTEHPDLEIKLKRLVTNHPNLLSKNFICISQKVYQKTVKNINGL